MSAIIIELKKTEPLVIIDVTWNTSHYGMTSNKKKSFCYADIAHGIVICVGALRGFTPSIHYSSLDTMN